MSVYHYSRELEKRALKEQILEKIGPLIDFSSLEAFDIEDVFRSMAVGWKYEIGRHMPVTEKNVEAALGDAALMMGLAANTDWPEPQWGAWADAALKAVFDDSETRGDEWFSIVGRYSLEIAKAFLGGLVRAGRLNADRVARIVAGAQGSKRQRIAMDILLPYGAWDMEALSLLWKKLGADGLGEITKRLGESGRDIEVCAMLWGRKKELGDLTRDTLRWKTLCLENLAPQAGGELWKRAVGEVCKLQELEEAQRCTYLEERDDLTAQLLDRMAELGGWEYLLDRVRREDYEAEVWACVSHKTLAGMLSRAKREDKVLLMAAVAKATPVGRVKI